MRTFVTLVTTLITLVPLAAFAFQPPDPDPPSTISRNPRVRPYDGRSAQLLLEGLERSVTLRAIVDRLEQLDVIVYLEMQPALRKRLAGTLTWLAATTSYRYVRISLNPEMMHDALISALGHELQHALEVAEAPWVVDPPSLQAYYEKHGLKTASQHINGWDSLAARLIGDEVRRDLVGVRAARVVADSIQTFNPQEWHIVYRRARSMLPP
jgi:hypothetical protein